MKPISGATVVKAPDQRSEAASEQVSLLTQVHKVEDDSLVSVNIVHREVKPKAAKYFAKKTTLRLLDVCCLPVSGVAGVGPDKQVVLVLADEVHPT